MNETRTYTLRHPLEIAGEAVTELVFKRPRTKELRKAVDGSTGTLHTAVRLMAITSGHAEGVIDQLDPADFMQAQNALQELLPAALLDDADEGKA